MTDQIDSNVVRAACERVRAAVRNLQKAVEHASSVGIEVDLVEIDNPTLGNPNSVVYDVRMSLDVTYFGEGRSAQEAHHHDDN